MKRISGFGIGDRVSESLIARNGILSGVSLMGIVTLRHLGPGGDLLHEETGHNLFTNEGLDALLDDLFGAGGTYYIGLKDDAAAPAAGHTAAQIGGTNVWDEITTYDEATREAYTVAAAASQQVTNSASVASFAINATDDVGGIFMIDVSTKGATSGNLITAIDFASARSVQSGDTLEVTYTISAADDGV